MIQYANTIILYNKYIYVNNFSTGCITGCAPSGLELHLLYALSVILFLATQFT